MHILRIYQLIQNLHVVGIGPIILLCLKEEPLADPLQNLSSVPFFKIVEIGCSHCLLASTDRVV